MQTRSIPWCSRLLMLVLLLQTGGPVAAAIGPAPAAGERQRPLELLDQACQRARHKGDLLTLRTLQRALLQVSPAPQPLPVVLANADALLRCGAPDAALTVLNRYRPAPGPEQVQWLLLQWRAANAALDHRLAADALRQLAVASGRSLEQLVVPMAQDSQGRLQTVVALDVLVGHLDALGQPAQAAQLLFSSRAVGEVGAQRLAQAVAWSPQLPLAERLRWLDRALEQAAAAAAWGLALALLDQQLVLLEGQPAALRQPVEQRRQRLGRRLDDANALDRQVRSPRDPGGHAASIIPVLRQP